VSVIRCAISPDADDLFMFRGLLEGHVDTRGLCFEITTRDTDTLNRMAAGDEATADVTAISIAHYPRVAARYRLLSHGGSVGRGYGPVVVAGSSDVELHGARIAVPGLGTTAYAVLRMALGDFQPVVIPIDPYAQVFDALRHGKVDAALLIHEGRLTYAAEGLTEVLELGRWWHERTGLPLPLGGNVIRRALGPEVIARASAAIRDSIAHALADRDAAIDWLLARGGALRTRERVDRYLRMYANDDTLDYGRDGREAIRRVLAEAAARGWVPAIGEIDYA
jgi:1,4-dihydroxy-6-naphthoate synthase